MRTIVSIPIDRIRLSKYRPVIDGAVDAIAASMAQVGLITPITVKPRPVFDGSIMVDGYGVVTGNHRVKGAMRLGWTEIEAIVAEGDEELLDEMTAIDENLCRTDLSPAQQAEALARRKDIWQALGLEVSVVEFECGSELGGTACSTQLETDSRGQRKSRQQKKGFAESTAEATGKSKQDINRAIKRGTELCAEALELVRGTTLDKGAFLDRLVKMKVSPREQVDRVREALDALADKEKRQQLADESKAREKAAKQEREDAKNEACNFLFNKLGAVEWGYLIDMLERSGGSLKADTLRRWEAPLAKAA